MSCEKKPDVVFWTTVVVVLVLYVASFGPVCWVTDWLDKEPDWQRSLEVAYQPLLFSVARCPARVQNALILYGDPHGSAGTAWNLVNYAAHEARQPH